MCGRATLSSPAEDVAEIFDALPIDIGPARFNIAPSQPIVTVRPSSHSSRSSTQAKQKNTLAMMRWGLIPWWAKADEAKRIASKCIQARAETVQSGGAFRDAFKRHRCLVVFDGFFEWKTLPDGRRIPHHIRKTDRTPFAVAGVWDSWRDPEREGTHNKNDDDDERIMSCAVLTTSSAKPIRDVHTRMPLILPANEWAIWLEGSDDEAATLLHLDTKTRADRAREMLIIPVSTWVNNVKHDDAKCIEPTPIAAANTEQISFSFGDVPLSSAPKKKARRA